MDRAEQFARAPDAVALTTKAEDRLVRDELYRRWRSTRRFASRLRAFPMALHRDVERMSALARVGEDRIAKTIVDQVLGES